MEDEHEKLQLYTEKVGKSTETFGEEGNKVSPKELKDRITKLEKKVTGIEKGKGSDWLISCIDVAKLKKRYPEGGQKKGSAKAKPNH